MMGPLAKTGFIDPITNLVLAALIGFAFGFALQRGGFTDSRKIAGVFYLKDLDVPMVMFTAMVTGMLGLWGLAFLGLLDTSQMYFLPTYLTPMVFGGFILGMGMVVGGYCPGTAVASGVTGKVDAWVFLLGFLIGTWSFGDAFPYFAELYKSDYMGVFRIDHWLGINLGGAVLLVIAFALAVSFTLRRLQAYFWKDAIAQRMILPRPAVAALVVAGVVYALVPTGRFLAIEDTAGATGGWRAEWQADPRETVVLPVAAAETLYWANSDRALLVDVRDGDAYAAGHLPEAVNIPLAVLHAARFPESSLVVVYGADTDEGRVALRILRERLQVRAYAVVGGYAEARDWSPGDDAPRLAQG